MCVGELLQNQFPSPEFVGGVRVRMGQGDGNGLDPFVTKMRCRRSHRVFVEGGEDSAVEGGAFRKFKDEFRGYRAFRFDPDMGVGHPGHAVSPDFQDIFEPLGYQHPDGCAFALQNSVGGYGGAVEDATNLRVGHAPRAEYLREAGNEAPRRVVGSGWRLEQL